MVLGIWRLVGSVGLLCFGMALYAPASAANYGCAEEGGASSSDFTTPIPTASEAGHLIGEYPGRSGPGAQTEYIYLDGVPIAATRGGVLYYIEIDQLGTPRQVIKPGVTTAGDTTVWKWDYSANNSAFGENSPSVQTMTFNLRFPGQYYDAETGLNYNYFRDYEPGIGRYVEPDPVGIRGEASDLYAYASEDPLRFFDPKGLFSMDVVCDYCDGKMLTISRRKFNKSAVTSEISPTMP